MLFPFLMLPMPTGGNLDLNQRTAVAGVYFGSSPSTLNVPRPQYNYRKKRNQ
jgi:hypothetical protein